MIKPYKILSLKSKKKLELYKIQGIKNNKNILIIGTFHGDEPQGNYVIKKYIKDLTDLKSHNTVYFLPCFNPDGLKLNQRKNVNNVDLNRNFPTKNWGKTYENEEFFGGNSACSEEETKFMVELINNIKPDLILTLHSPFGVVNYDGEAKFVSQKIAEFLDYPVQKDIGYPTPGSFGTYCGVERKIPTVTVEYSDKENFDDLCKKTKPLFEYLRMEYK